jgi:hypothetical protein
MLHDGYVLKLVIGFPWKIYLFLSAKKVFIFAHQRGKKKPQWCPNRLITVDAVLSSCLPLRQMLIINLHMSLPSSTHPWLEGCIVLYRQQVWQHVAAIEEISFDWQAAANVLWVSCVFICKLSFFLTLLIGFLLWLMRGPPQPVLSGKHRERERERERESSISEVGQWTFLLLQHDSRDRIRSFFFCPPGKINQSKAQYIIFKLFFLLLLLLLLLLPPIMYMVSAWFFLVFLPHWLCAHSDPIHVKRNINFWKPKFGSNPKLTSPHHIQTANLQSEPKSIIFGWNLWSSNY